MKWFKRLLLMAPCVIAAVLTALMIAAAPSHQWRRSEHIAGYGFLFATPGAWLIEGVFGVFGLKEKAPEKLGGLFLEES